jgi:hypothetical protein
LIQNFSEACPSPDHLKHSLLGLAKQLFSLAALNADASPEPPHHRAGLIKERFAAEREPLKVAVTTPQAYLALAPIFRIACSPPI